MRVRSLLATLFLSTVVSSGCGPTEPTEDESQLDTTDSEPAAPPANWSKLSTTSAPTYLAVYAQKDNNAGTNNTLVLTYANRTASYWCTIDGVSKGETKGCTPSKTTSTTASGHDQFYIGYWNKRDSDDGLRISSIKVTLDGTTYSKDDFDNGAGNLTCTGCNALSRNCGSCWIDGQVSGFSVSVCHEARIPMTNDVDVDCSTN